MSAFLIEPSTYLALQLLCALVLAAMVGWASRRADAPGLRRWLAGLLLAALGCVLLAQGSRLGAWSLALVFSVFTGSALCFLLALTEFSGRKPSRLWLLPAPLLLAAMLALLLHEPVTLALVGSLAFALSLLGIATLAPLLRGLPSPGLFVAPSALGAVVVAAWGLRSHAALGRGELPPADALSTACYAVLFVLLLTTTFAFLELHRQQATGRIRQLADLDGLTGLLNRRCFLERAERAHRYAARTGARYAVAMLDIDWFKRINDRFGHAAGDEVLVIIGQQLRAAFGADTLLARYGGEEFCVLLPDAGIPDAIACAEDARHRIECLRLKVLEMQRFTISAGVATCTDASGESLAAVIARADEALYEAKRHGRNRVNTAPPPHESASVLA